MTLGVGEVVLRPPGPRSGLTPSSFLPAATPRHPKDPSKAWPRYFIGSAPASALTESAWSERPLRSLWKVLWAPPHQHLAFHQQSDCGVALTVSCPVPWTSDAQTCPVLFRARASPAEHSFRRFCFFGFGQCQVLLCLCRLELPTSRCLSLDPC